MPKHAERRHMPEGPPLCMQMTHFTWLTPSSRRKYLNMPKSNMPKHAERRNMPEGPHLCMQKSKLKHAKIKHAEARSRPTGESAETCQNQTCRSKRKDETCLFACKWPISLDWLVVATPATQNDSRGEVVPRLPRKVPRRHRRPSQSKHATQCHASHACHAKRRWMRVCATPATWNVSGCEFVPRLPRKVPRRHRRPSQSKHATQCHASHACHAKRRWMRVCATPATWNVSGCEFVPRLPRKVPRRHRRPSQSKHATQPSVPRLPRKTTVDASLCHACHVKRQ